MKREAQGYWSCVRTESLQMKHEAVRTDNRASTIKIHTHTYMPAPHDRDTRMQKNFYGIKRVLYNCVCVHVAEKLGETPAALDLFIYVTRDSSTTL